jgi:menaquinone-dependent protoporphyrinogen oxidase
MKVLVGYATVHGSTGEVAQRIGDVLAQEGLEVTVADVGTLTQVDEYDAFVMGSAIHAGTWLPELTGFMKTLKNRASRTPVYIWVTCIRVLEEYGMSHALDYYMLPDILNQLNVRGKTAFAGKLDIDQVDVNERWSLAARYDGHAWPTNFNGDFRDWNKITEWASETAKDIQKVAETQ